MIPSPTDLTYFLEAATTENLSRAAERLGIAQPSLSLAIQRLEQNLGTPVLIRSKRGVTLTQAGKQLLTHGRALLQTWEQVRAKALGSVNEVQGSFRIGAHPSVALYSVPAVLAELLRKYPLVQVNLIHDLSRKIVESVISSHIDIGIVVNPVRHPDLVIQKLGEDRVTFWTLDEKEPIRNINSGKCILLCDPDLAQTQTLLKQIQKRKWNIDRVVSSGSLEVIAELTARGCGVGVLPTRVAMQSSAKKLVEVDKAPFFEDEICVVYRTENRGVQAIKHIVHSFQESFR